MIWLVLIGFISGIMLGSFFPLMLPADYVRYLSVAILACLDTVLGGLRALVEHKFDNVVFLSGFFANSLLAVILVYFGDNVGVDLYLAAVVVFGVRVFQNLAVLRRVLVDRWQQSQIIETEEKENK